MRNCFRIWTRHTTTAHSVRSTPLNAANKYNLFFCFLLFVLFRFGYKLMIACHLRCWLIVPLLSFIVIRLRAIYQYQQCSTRAYMLTYCHINIYVRRNSSRHTINQNLPTNKYETKQIKRNGNSNYSLSVIILNYVFIYFCLILFIYFLFK